VVARISANTRRNFPPGSTKTGRAQMCSKPMKIYLDGQFVDEAEAKISVFDHACFMAMAFSRGSASTKANIFRSTRTSTTVCSAKALLLTSRSPAGKWPSGLRVLPPERLRDGYIRLVSPAAWRSRLSPWLCRSRRSYHCRQDRAISTRALHDGLSIVTVPTRRVGPAALPPMVKSLNYLNNILAKIEARQPAPSKRSCSTTLDSSPNAPATTSSSCTRDA